MSTPVNIKNFLKDANINVVQDNTPRRVVGVSVAPVRRSPRAVVRRRVAMNAFETPPSTPITRRAKSLSPVSTRVRLPDPKILNSDKKASPVRVRFVPNPKTSSLVFAPLDYKMYNATSKPAVPVKVNVIAITRRKPRTLPVRVPGDYFFVKVESIRGCDEQFKCAATSRKTTAQITGEIVRGVEKSNFTMYVFNNGTVRITGGVPGDNPVSIVHVRDHLLKTYTNGDRELFAPLRFSNLNAQFRFNGTFKPDVLKRVLLREKLPFTYEPEIKQNFVKVSYMNHTFQLWFSGLVQMFGYKSRRALEAAYVHGKSLVKLLEMEGAVSGKQAFSSPIRKRKRVNQNEPSNLTLDDMKRMNMCKMSKKQLLTYAKLSGVILPKHILKANICKRIKNAQRVATAYSNNQITKDLLNMYGATWVKKYDWLVAHDLPKDVRQVQKLIARARTKNEIVAIERDYVAKVKASRKKMYDTAHNRLVKAVSDLF